MRFDQATDPDAVHAWVVGRSLEVWGEERTGSLEVALRSLAEAMVAVAGAEVPDDEEPRFP